MNMKIDIFYDGECPFCNNFVQLSKLKESHQVALHDLRNNVDQVQLFLEKGYDVNEGMVVIIDEEIHYGYESIYIISILSNRDKCIGKIYYFLFSNKIVTKFLYPAMRLGRNVTLFLLGRKKI